MVSIFQSPVFHGGGGDTSRLLFENFTGANATNLHGRAPTFGPYVWDAVNGTWTIDTNRATQDATASPGDGRLLLADVEDPNVDISGWFRAPMSGGMIDGLALRCESGSVYNNFELNESPATLAFYKYPNIGGPSVALLTHDHTPVNGALYYARLIAYNNYLTIYAAGPGVGVAMSTSNFTHLQSATKHGLFNVRSVGRPGASYWDDLTILAVNAKPPLHPCVFAPFSGEEGNSAHNIKPVTRILHDVDWVQVLGSALIQSNRAVCQNSVTANVLYYDSQHSDCRIEIKGKIGATNGNHAMGIVFRGSDTNNFLYTYFDGTGAMQLWKREGGSFSKIMDGTGWAADTLDHVLYVEVNGTSIKAGIDGVEKLSTTSSLFSTSTRHGFIGFVNGGLAASFIHFRVLPI